MTDVWPPWGSAEALNAWSALVTAVIAGGAAFAAFGQIRQSKSSSDNTEAQEAYRRYLELAIEYPGFASPNYLAIKQDYLLKEQYNWYVSYLLLAVEKIIDVTSGVGEWNQTIRLNVGYHAGILRDKSQFEDEQIACYSEYLREIIAVVSGRLIPSDQNKRWAHRVSETQK